MNAKEAVLIVVRMAQDRPEDSEEGQALRIVLRTLKEPDKVSLGIEASVLMMTHRLEEATAHETA